MCGHVASDDSRCDAQSSKATAKSAGEVPTLSKFNASLCLEELTENLFRVQPCTRRLSIPKVLIPFSCSEDGQKIWYCKQKEKIDARFKADDVLFFGFKTFK